MKTNICATLHSTNTELSDSSQRGASCRELKFNTSVRLALCKEIAYKTGALLCCVDMSGAQNKIEFPALAITRS